MRNIDDTYNYCVSLIAALSEETRAIGKEGKLLWNLPEDLARFKDLTSSHPVIMGRKTWESIPEKFRPLPGRTNIVITRDPTYEVTGAVLASSFEEALSYAQASPGSEEIFVIGGEQIYEMALPFADRLYLTLVHDAAEGDAYFPDYSEFTEVTDEQQNAGAPSFSFVTLERSV